VKSKSCKAKGRRLQQDVREKLIEVLGIHEKDIKSTTMGEAGLDVFLASGAREKFPYGIECKNVERLNVWDAWKQCRANAKKEGLTPMLVIHRNNSPTLAVLELDEALKLIKGAGQ
jgi:hypothetical protein